MAEFRKKKQEEVEEGAPAWMLTFGDMMTLLLTFFVLLFSMSTISEKKFVEVLGSISTYFGIGANVTNPEPISPEEIVERLLSIPPQRQFQDGTIVEDVEGYHVRVTKIDEGVKLTIGGKALFEPGRAELTEDAKEAVREVARLITGYRNRIRVLGHTDPAEERELDRQKFRDLYDLGYERAHAVRAYLIDPDQVGEENRIHPARIELSSAAHQQPAVPNMGEGISELESGREPLERGKLFNRRVEIVVTEALVPWYMVR